MSAADKLLEEGYEDVVFFTDYSYDDALIGVDTDNRAVYDFNKMVNWLIEKEDFDNEEEAIEWIEYNTIRSLPYIYSRTDGRSPIIMYPFDWRV
jgi:hypothetical protein